MKLITLNTWGGKIHQPLLSFIHRMNGDVDIFCFQEVFNSESDLRISDGASAKLLHELSSILTRYQMFYSPKSQGYDYGGWIGGDIDFGNAMFIKKDIPVSDYEEMFDMVANADHDWKKSAIAKAQFVTVKINETPLAICNLHGLWIKDSHKKDNPERIEQSQHIRRVLDTFAGEKIICGDFNLVPEGESIKILGNGMRNLIMEYEITSTRSSFYKTTPGIQVDEFKVLPDEVSDHLALELGFLV